MKRIMLTGDAVGGVWRYSLDLSRGLIGRGVEVALAILGPPPSPAQAEAARLPGLHLLQTGLPLDWTSPDAATLRATAASLAALAQRLRVERAHLHTPALAAHAPWGVPVVVVAHSDVGTWWRAVRGGVLPAHLAWHAEAVAHGLAEADAVIAPTRAFAAALDTLYRPGRHIDVVHNGISAPHPRHRGTRARAVLAAGRLWDEGKNVGLLGLVAPALDAPILAAGPLAAPGGEAMTLPALHCLGLLSAEELAQRMAAATVFVSASRYEPFGLAVLEAAHAGMALALSDVPAHRELWDGAALFFHPEDPGAARDVLRRLLDAPAAWAARAVERAGRYTAEAVVDGTLAVHRANTLRRVA